MSKINKTVYDELMDKEFKKIDEELVSEEFVYADSGEIKSGMPVYREASSTIFHFKALIKSIKRDIVNLIDKIPFTIKIQLKPKAKTVLSDFKAKVVKVVSKVVLKTKSLLKRTWTWIKSKSPVIITIKKK